MTHVADYIHRSELLVGFRRSTLTTPLRRTFHICSFVILPCGSIAKLHPRNGKAKNCNHVLSIALCLCLMGKCVFVTSGLSMKSRMGCDAIRKHDGHHFSFLSFSVNSDERR